MRTPQVHQDKYIGPYIPYTQHNNPLQDCFIPLGIFANRREVNDNYESEHGSVKYETRGYV